MNLFDHNKKGQALNNVPAIVILLGFAGIIAGITLTIMEDVQATNVDGTAGCNATVTTSCGAAYNATGDAVEGVAELTERFPLIGLTFGLGIVLVILGGVFLQVRKAGGF